MSHKAPGKPPRSPRRLPFRVQVPDRNDLIAYALATLAVGLMVGLAIGPMVSGAASVTTLIIPGTTEPEAKGTVTETVAMVPSLNSPAGSEAPTSSGGGSTLVSDPAPASPPDPVDVPTDDSAADDYSEPVPPPDEPKPDPEPEKPDPEPEPEPEGVLLEGTVLANSPSTKTYWLNAGGDLTTVFAATVPDPGLVVSTRVTPLSNGTLAESDDRSAVDISRESVLKAVVSHLDPATGVLVLSGRGASLPVYSPEAVNLEGVEVGNRVEANLRLNVPDPENFSTAGFDPAEELPIQLEQVRKLADLPEIELTGKLVATDPATGLITLSSDSTGLLGSTIDLATPEGFPIETLVIGRLYSASAVRTEEAGLQLVGFSPVSGKAAADDPSLAFGTHAGQ